MNGQELEKRLGSMKLEVQEDLSGWEFTPALQQSVLERVLAETVPPEVPVSRRRRLWGPGLAVIAAAAAVAAIAVFTDGRSLHVDSTGDSVSQPLESRALRSAAPAAQPAPQAATAAAPAESDAAAAPSSPAAPGPAGSGSAAPAGGALGPPQAAAAESMAAAAADAQPQAMAVSPAPALAEGQPQVRASAPAAAVAESPAPAASIRSSALPPRAGQDTSAAKAAPAAAAASSSGPASAATAEEPFIIEVLPPEPGVPVRLGVRLRALGMIWTGPVEIRAWAMLAGGARLPLQPASYRLPDGVEKDGQAAVEFRWTGHGADGQPIPAGVYHIQAEARAADGQGRLFGVDVTLP